MDNFGNNSMTDWSIHRWKKLLQGFTTADFNFNERNKKDYLLIIIDDLWIDNHNHHHYHHH